VELITYDYQSDEKRAAAVAERLITQNKHDCRSVPVTPRWWPAWPNAGVPVMASVASSESVQPGLQYLFGTLAPNGGIVQSMSVLLPS
jgi:branched-chain amino acid transport system substrate-binding protein